jgi:hypothetical protein
MSNNFKPLLPFTRKGEELKDWIEKHKDDLKNQRIFYILKANMENKDIFKIGISERGDTSAYGRLNDYYHFYGTTKVGTCYGVKLHLVLANTFNPNVNHSDSRVRYVENKVKAHFKAIEKRERGSERFKVSIDELFNYMIDNNLLQAPEKETVVRQSPRVAESGQRTQDAVKSIVTHILPKTRRGVIKYEVEFYKARVYDRNQNSKVKQMPNKILTYDQLVGMRDGKQKVDEYNKKHLFN